jgi:hypothetical protein
MEEEGMVGGNGSGRGEGAGEWVPQLHALHVLPA